MSGVKKKKKVNYANRFVIILAVALIANLSFYWLPDTIFGYPVKKVDLLADIRILPGDENFEDENTEEQNPEPKVLPHKETYPEIYANKPTLPIPVPQNTIEQEENSANTTQTSPNTKETREQNGLSEKTDNTSAQISDDDKSNTNYLFNKSIEDFSAGRTSMRRFFAALNNRSEEHTSELQSLDQSRMPSSA